MADFDGDGFIGRDDICNVVSRITNDAAAAAAGGGDAEDGQQGDEEAASSRLTAADIDKIAKNVSANLFSQIKISALFLFIFKNVW